MATKDAVTRFWSYVQKTDGCWMWTGSNHGAGYGGFYVGGGQANRIRTSAHRFSYELANGPIPTGLEIDHLCRNRRCVRPDHLESVTHQENQSRRAGYKTGPYNVGTHCRRGHERSPENTRIDKRGARVCIPCNRLAVARSRDRRRNTAIS